MYKSKLFGLVGAINTKCCKHRVRNLMALETSGVINTRAAGLKHVANAFIPTSL